MALNIAQFKTWSPDDIELPSGAIYACRQISVRGLQLLHRATTAGDSSVTRDELVDVVVDLIRAPIAEVTACSVEELVAILVAASIPAGQLASTRTAQPAATPPSRTPAPRKARQRAPKRA